MTNFCFFHPDQLAVTKCEKCGKVICAECKMVYQEQHTNHHADDSTSTYIIRREYCTPCYYDTVQDMNSPMKMIIPIIGIIIFIVIAIAMFASFQSSIPSDPFFDDARSQSSSMFGLFLIVPVIFIIFLCFRMAQAPEKVEQAKNKKAQFEASIVDYKQNLQRNSSSSPIPAATMPISEKEQILQSKSNPTGKIYCQQCGKPINIEERFCSFCGDPTNDERKLHES
jgi:hypothetical protein